MITQGYAGELDVDAELAGMEERRRPMSAGDRIRGGISKGGKKRQAKDSKFGMQTGALLCSIAAFAEYVPSFLLELRMDVCCACVAERPNSYSNFHAAHVLVCHPAVKLVKYAWHAVSHCVVLACALAWPYAGCMTCCRVQWSSRSLRAGVAAT